jgi:hypothetical protein
MSKLHEQIAKALQSPGKLTAADCANYLAKIANRDLEIRERIRQIEGVATIENEGPAMRAAGASGRIEDVVEVQREAERLRAESQIYSMQREVLLRLKKEATAAEACGKVKSAINKLPDALSDVESLKQKLDAAQSRLAALTSEIVQQRYVAKRASLSPEALDEELFARLIAASSDDDATKAARRQNLRPQLLDVQPPERSTERAVWLT